MKGKILNALLLFSLLGSVGLAAPAPRPAPEYSVKLVSGRQIALSSLRGQVVVLMFVNTNCPHCQAMAVFLEQIYRRFAKQGLQVLAVAFDPDADKLVKSFVDRTRVSFPVGYDERDPVFAFLNRSVRQLTYVPILVFIDRKGMIRGQFMGDDPFLGPDDQQTGERNIRSLIESLLREGGGQRGK